MTYRNHFYNCISEYSFAIFMLNASSEYCLVQVTLFASWHLAQQAVKLLNLFFYELKKLL